MTSTTLCACKKKDERTVLYQNHNVLHLPTPDYSGSSVEQIKNGVEFIHEHVGNGKTLVHCKSGIGRSAVIVVAYLCVKEGYEFK